MNISICNHHPDEDIEKSAKTLESSIMHPPQKTLQTLPQNLTIIRSSNFRILNSSPCEELFHKIYHVFIL